MRTKIFLDVLSLAIFLLVLNACQPKPVEKQKPNFLFILADDFGYHDLSISGSKYYETSNIDKIANKGMIFTDGYAACLNLKSNGLIFFPKISTREITGGEV